MGFLNFCKMVLTMNCEGDHLHPEGLSCHGGHEFSSYSADLGFVKSQFLASKAVKILAGLGFPAYLFLGNNGSVIWKKYSEFSILGDNRKTETMACLSPKILENFQITSVTVGFDCEIWESLGFHSTSFNRPETS